MNRIITISREFGSGGRELGKRLAQKLNVAYYDREIVTAIAQKSDLAESYVNQIVEHHIVNYYPITVANSFSTMPFDAMGQINRSIYSAQTDVLRDIAAKSPCVIVGRCADYILRESRPLNIFVYASMENKIRRCREQGTEFAELSDKELQRKIQQIDKGRAKYYSAYTGRTWGDKANYDLCINTSDADLDVIASMVAHMFE